MNNIYYSTTPAYTAYSTKELVYFCLTTLFCYHPLLLCVYVRNAGGASCALREKMANASVFFKNYNAKCGFLRIKIM